jgi:gliding motility-associated lipoprotein GldH
MKNSLFLFFLFILIISCDRQHVYENFAGIKGSSWNNKSILHFNVNIADTIHAHNVYLIVRSTSKYEYSNLYLFVTTHSPNLNVLKDTVEIALASDNGKWLGRGAASIYTITFPYKMNVRFPVRGIYTFDVEQAMWVKDLRNISDIGIRVEKASDKSSRGK